MEADVTPEEDSQAARIKIADKIKVQKRLILSSASIIHKTGEEGPLKTHHTADF